MRENFFLPGRRVVLTALGCLVLVVSTQAAGGGRVFVPTLEPILLADFDDQPLGSIGEEGAGSGQPVYSFGLVSGEVIEVSAGNQALQVTKYGESTISALYNWGFLDGLELRSGVVTFTFNLTLNSMGNQSVTVRNGSFTGGQYIQLAFNRTGNAYLAYPNSASTPVAYTTGQQYPVRISCDIDQRLCDLSFDNQLIAEDVAFSGVITDPAIGGLQTGFNGSADVGAELVIDDLTVTATNAAAIPVTLAFTGQPSDVEIGESVQPPVTIEALNVFDEPAAIVTPLTLTASGGDVGAVLSGGTVDTVDGVATFDSLSIDKAGVDYRLEAVLDDWPEVAAVASEPFDVTHPLPASMEFVHVPASIVTGQVASPAIEVDVTDSKGHPIADGTVVTLSIHSGPASGAFIDGTTVRATTDGTAAFDDLSFATPGDYVLQAVTDNGISTTSGLIVVVPDRIFHDRMELLDSR